MIFRKDIEPCCSYCAHGNVIGEAEVICIKRGVVSAGGSCSKFSYDPLKREPPRHSFIKTALFSEEDFKLEP